MYLLIVDTSQIQPYVFGSNRLRENIGASHLVASATDHWAKDIVNDVTGRTNIGLGLKLDDQRIEDLNKNLDAEVIYAGGGNFVVVFREKSLCDIFIRKLSRKTLLQAPNLNLVFSCTPFDWNQSLSAALDDAFRQLAREKRSLVPSAPLLGLGVTATCRSTGLPAVGDAPPVGDDSSYPASAEILAKLTVVDDANERLRSFVSLPAGYAFPNEFDKLGRTKGHHSYVAVVHADGDGMGERLQTFSKEFRSSERNRECVTELRRFSQAVQTSSRNALRQTVDALRETVDQLDEGLDGRKVIVYRNGERKELTRLELNKKGEEFLLPFRPLVFGGDDLTFVCDGRFGLSLAVEYLQRFEQCSKARNLTASAGIAIVKVHYPFSRAYSLAQKLCRSAKDYRREQKLEGSCLDWHFALSGVAGGPAEIRAREYTADDGSLTLRPVALSDNPERHRRWLVIEKGVREFQGPNWAGRRNKAKALREALRAGEATVAQFVARLGEPLPDVEPTLTDWPNLGWQLKHCGYFDALELADWFIPLGNGGLR